MSPTFHSPVLCERHAPVITREDFAAAEAEQRRRDRAAAKAEHERLLDKLAIAERNIRDKDCASDHDLTDADMLAGLIADSAAHIGRRFLAERILQQWKGPRPTIAQITASITTAIIEGGLNPWLSPNGQSLLDAQTDLHLEGMT